MAAEFWKKASRNISIRRNRRFISKGKNLYGLNKAKEEIRKKGFALIVEGYFDLISLWNAGICNVVATLGTALTREHLELLSRYTVEVVALFDPDEAGIKALDRSLELFLSMTNAGAGVNFAGRMRSR